MLHYACILLFIHFIHFEFQFSILFRSRSLSLFSSLLLPLSLLCCSILFSSLGARSFSTEFGLFAAAFPQHTNTMAQADRKWRGSLIARHCCGLAKSGERGGGAARLGRIQCNEGWWPRDLAERWGGGAAKLAGIRCLQLVNMAYTLHGFGAYYGELRAELRNIYYIYYNI